MSQRRYLPSVKSSESLSGAISPEGEEVSLLSADAPATTEANTSKTDENREKYCNGECENSPNWRE